jgi:hypothetical protein
MQTTIKKMLGIGSAIILTAVVFGYGYFRTKDFLEGPVLEITTPKNGEMFSSALISVAGLSKNLSFLSIDGRKIFTNKDGVWEEKLLLQNGVNIIEVQATDRFGRENTQVMRVVYDETKI